MKIMMSVKINRNIKEYPFMAEKIPLCESCLKVFPGFRGLKMRFLGFCPKTLKIFKNFAGKTSIISILTTKPLEISGLSLRDKGNSKKNENCIRDGSTNLRPQGVSKGKIKIISENC